MITLYFDNNIWLRPFQTNSGRSEKEAVAVNLIIEKCCENYRIITSEFQENYFFGTQHSRTLSNDQKDAFAKGLAVCQSVAEETKDLFCNHDIETFSTKVNLNDREDRVHIVLAWRKEANYFITADKELYESKKSEIEEALEFLNHPTANNNTNKMQILNPVPFVEQFLSL